MPVDCVWNISVKRLLFSVSLFVFWWKVYSLRYCIINNLSYWIFLLPWNLYSKKEIIICILYFIGHCHFVWCKTNSSCIKGWKGEKEFPVFVWIQQKARLDHNSPQISVHCVSCRGHRSRSEVLSIRTYPSEGNRLLIINPFRYTCTFPFHKTIKTKCHL